MSIAYGQIYIADGDTEFTVGAAAKLTLFNTAAGVNGEASGSSSGGDKSIICDKANSKLTLKPGVYKLDFTASVSGDDRGKVQFNLRVGATELAGGQSQISVGDSAGDLSDMSGSSTNNSHVSVAISCIAAVTAEGDLEVYVEGDALDLNIRHAQLCAVRID